MVGDSGNDNGSVLYGRWLAELWSGDLTGLDQVAAELVTEDFVGNWPGRPGLVHGPAELAEVIRQGRLPFDGMAFETELGPVVGDGLDD